MAITLAQAVGGAIVDGASVLDLVYGSNVTAGNRIVIAISGFQDDTFNASQWAKQAGTATIGAFTLDHSRYNAGATQGAAIASALVTGSGSLTIRYTIAGGNDYLIGGRLELASDTGWDAGFLEDTADAGGSSTTPATGDMTAAGAAIFVAALAVSTGSNITITPGGDYTQVFEEQDGSAHMVGGSEYRIVGTGTTDSPDWTITSSPWDVAGVVYKGAAASIGTAAVTGTAEPTATEAEMVTGGQTTVVTLTGDALVVAAGGLFDAQRQAAIDGCVSAQSEANGFNNEVRDNTPVTAVVRTSDTSYTITWPATAGYAITATETITVTVPSTITLLNAGDITATPTFDITPDAGDIAASEGTALGGMTRAFANAATLLSFSGPGRGGLSRAFGVAIAPVTAPSGSGSQIIHRRRRR